MKHRTFLTWLVYAAIVATFWVVAYEHGLPQLILAHDSSHLSLVLFLTYVVAEALALRQIVALSKLEARGVLIHAEKVEDSALVGNFLSEQIVLVGILGTIVGVIMAFWPFLDMGSNVDAMRSHMGAFFSGVATAFIPTALSFVLKIILDFNTRIIVGGLNRIDYV